MLAGRMSRASATRAESPAHAIGLRDQPDFLMDTTGGIAVVVASLISSPPSLQRKNGVKTTCAVFWDDLGPV